MERKQTKKVNEQLLKVSVKVKAESGSGLCVRRFAITREPCDQAQSISCHHRFIMKLTRQGECRSLESGRDHRELFSECSERTSSSGIARSGSRKILGRRSGNSLFSYGDSGAELMRLIIVVNIRMPISTIVQACKLITFI